jgi:hypothetical protein
MTKYKIKLTKQYGDKLVLPGIMLDCGYYLISEEGSCGGYKRQKILRLLSEELNDTRADVGELELATEFIALEKGRK